MFDLLRIIAAVLLLLHGLVHVMGLAVYLDLATIEGLPYPATLLDGAIEVGEGAVRLLGVLWGLAALGFFIAAAWLLTRRRGWRALLLVVAVLSLVLSALAWPEAAIGVAANLAILVLVALSAVPRRQAAGAREDAA